MILHIDIQTGLYTFILVHLVCGILGVAYSMQDKSSHIDINFLFTQGFNVLGWLLVMFNNKNESPYMIMFAMSCIVIGSVLQIRTLLMIIGYFSIRVKRYYYLVTTLSLVYIYIVCQFHWLNYDIVLVAMLIVMMIVWCYPLYTLFKKKCTILQKVFGAVYIVSFIACVLGIIQSGPLKLQGKEYTFLLYSSIYINTLVGNIGCILISKEKSDEKVRYQASYDELTNIMNRRSFMVTANNRLCLMKSLKKSLTFLLLDLDHFKGINDKYGHDIGDKVLIDFAKRVKNIIRDNDIFGRYGGEEFTILLSDIEYDNSLKIANRILEEINSVTLEKDLRYTVSIGMVTLIPKEDTTIEELIKLSDRALYKAKDNGRNRVETIGLEDTFKVVMEQMNEK